MEDILDMGLFDDVADVHDDDDTREYSSITFDVRTTSLLPVEFVTIRSIWIRGEFGCVSIYVIPRTCRWSQPSKEWRLAYCGEHEKSSSLKEMVLNEPVTIASGEGIGLFVHYACLPSSELSYGGRKRPFRSLKIFPEPSIAHSPFGKSFSSWREDPEFVARLGVSAKYSAWSPDAHAKFPPPFKAIAVILLLSFRRLGLSRDVVAAVLSACHCNWWGTDDSWFASSPDSSQKRQRSRCTRDRVQKRKRKLRSKIRRSFSSSRMKRDKEVALMLLSPPCSTVVSLSGDAGHHLSIV